MTLFIFGNILNLFGHVLKTYGLDLNSIHHSYFYTDHFSPIAQPFSTLSLYPHGDIKPLEFAAPYDNISDISESIHPHFIFWKVLY